MPAVRTKTPRRQVQIENANAQDLGVGTSKSHERAAALSRSNSTGAISPSQSRKIGRQSKRVREKRPYLPPPVKSMRPDPLKPRDLQFIDILGRGSYGSVSTVRVLGSGTRKNTLERPGTVFALKSLSKKSQREMEMNTWTDAHDCDEEKLKYLAAMLEIRDAERRHLTELPWHPFLCGLVDAFDDERNCYLLMEYAPCESFGAYLEQHGPLRSEDARFYFANITLALEFLHSHDIGHRDIKPMNILMGADGYLMLADFGMAAKVDSPHHWKHVGTPSYMPPECIGESLDPRVIPQSGKTSCDWWGAAVTLYYMVTLNVPFGADKGNKVYKQIMSVSPETYWSKGKAGDVYIDDELKNLVTMMLVPELSQRYGTMVVKDEGEILGENDEVRIHPFLNGHVDWEKMNLRMVAPPYVPDVYPDMSMRRQKSVLDSKELPGMARFQYPVELEYNRLNARPKK